jgi:flagellin
MQINHNIRAMVTQHSLYSNNTQMSKSLEKLSTGLRINRAQDDAAGLAMSEQMRTQIRGLGKAKQNSQDSIAALQIAEGGLAEITNLMQRQRELAVQSANDTLTSTERKYLDDEFQSLTKEIARIAKTTDYNGKNMLNWDEDPNLSFGAVGDINRVKDEFSSEKKILTDIINGLSTIAATANVKTQLQAIITQIATITGAATKAAVELAAAALSTAIAGVSYSSVSNIKDKEIIQSVLKRMGTIVNDNQSIDSLSTVFSRMVENEKFLGVPASYTLHVGSNYSFGLAGKWGNEIMVTYTNFSPSALGLTTQKITSQNDATRAIDKIDSIIKEASANRAAIGTFINRLEFTINNVANLEFNTQDAESRIRDTDFAKETTNFTRNQIMVQSATSMLAQANALPQAVLGLLG